MATTSPSSSGASTAAPGGTNGQVFQAVSTLPPVPTITIHAAPPEAPTPPLAATLPTASGNWTYVYTPSAGGTLNESTSSNSFVLEGIGSRDYLVGGTSNNILDPGAGENTMTNPGTKPTLYVHHSGATDNVTDFHPGVDRLTADAALFVTANQPGTIIDQNTGTSSPGLILTFDDNSHMTLQGITAPFNPDWLVHA